MLLIPVGLLCPIPDNFQVIPLSFSSNLDQLNPNIPEWREDIGQVVTKILAKVGLQHELATTCIFIHHIMLTRSK